MDTAIAEPRGQIFFSLFGRYLIIFAPCIHHLPIYHTQLILSQTSFGTLICTRLTAEHTDNNVASNIDYVLSVSSSLLCYSVAHELT